MDIGRIKIFFISDSAYFSPNYAKERVEKSGLERSPWKDDLKSFWICGSDDGI